MTWYRDDEGTRLPIRLDSTSNGEFMPRPLAPRAHYANTLATEFADGAARRLGWGRRRFLASACGAAASLMSINRAYAGKDPGGGYVLDPAAAFEPEAALEALGGREFIFDVQTHHINPGGAWRSGSSVWKLWLRAFPQARCEDGLMKRVFGSIDCLSSQHFIKEIFLDSDTDLAVLSFVPSPKEKMPLTLEEGDEARRIVEALEGTQRLLMHGPISPLLPGDVDRMAAMRQSWPIAAWKTYTQWGPDRKGYWLDDPEIGTPFLERIRALGPRRLCIHKGLPFPNKAYEYSLSRDIGVVARQYPDIDFIIYHSGYDPDHREGPYDPHARRQRGTDSLIASLQENGIAPNSNVYAELGSSWRSVMRDPDQAAHFLGKLLRFVGEDRVLWGTDSIWYGSPQDQIQAFRAFQISARLQEEQGYPALTPALRAKVFGLNAARVYGISADEVLLRARTDHIERMRERYHPEAEPSFLTYGPRTRREFLDLLALNGGRPL